jgi:hypothetical protein
MESTEKFIKNVSVWLPIEYYQKLKSLCYDGKTSSAMAKDIIMNFIDRCNLEKESNK